MHGNCTILSPPFHYSKHMGHPLPSAASYADSSDLFDNVDINLLGAPSLPTAAAAIFGDMTAWGPPARRFPGLTGAIAAAAAKGGSSVGGGSSNLSLAELVERCALNSLPDFLSNTSVKGRVFLRPGRS